VRFKFERKRRRSERTASWENYKKVQNSCNETVRAKKVSLPCGICVWHLYLFIKNKCLSEYSFGKNVAIITPCAQWSSLKITGVFTKKLCTHFTI
jgi:hypothetical protein